ncbi:hypothetical protein DV451_000835 [Geotrichum candidum]|uniref:AP180 N-terminal homology (ANTH) domain-containing protein n=1 Tax=Geotrichum candidum TaxID=1173061 RepID=A0A9P5GA99_GEOCN|nr:hypothetical protein DV451_000835 [Geotrichum candidum]
MSTDIAKVIKGATKPKEAPPKEKYILAIKRYLQQPSPSSEVLFATVSQLLLPKLNSPSLVVSLKAHIVFHHLLSDRSLKKYALFALIAKYYASANRSSVDCTVGAGTSGPFMYFANPPAFPTPSLYDQNDSSDSLPQTPQHSQHSQSHSRLHKLRPSPSLSFLSNFSSRSDHHQSAENSLETLNTQSSKQKILPNLAHSLPQASGVNRLVSAYNRYLRERVLHYRQLQLDPITEKIHKTSIVDDENYASQDFSNPLLSQIQCVIQQIRLLLACIFNDQTLNHPLYYYCYNLVAKDLSILFRFLNIALVIALQNFFTLSTSNAERTLFAYKEYTQLQIPEEVLSYVRQAPNAVSPADLEIPQALKQDKKAITTLTKSLENYLYEISINESNDLATNSTAPASTITTTAPPELNPLPAHDTSKTNPYATATNYDGDEGRVHLYPSNGGGADSGGLGVYYAPPVPAYAHDDVSTINSAASSAESTYNSPNPQHPYTVGVLNDHDDYTPTNGSYVNNAYTTPSSDHPHQNDAAYNPGNQKISGDNLLKKKASGIMKKFKKIST